MPENIPKQSKLPHFLLIVVILIVLSVGGIFAYQKYFPSPPVIAPTSQIPANWKTYRAEVLGIEYKLPPTLALDKLSGQESAGESGFQYCAVFMGAVSKLLTKPVFAGSGYCGGGSFNLSTISRDYSAGREGGFGDYNGYVIENNKYYVLFVNNSKIEIAANLVSEKTNPNGLKYLKIIGEESLQYYGDEQMMLTTMGTPGKGRLGAMFNLKNQKYNGFGVSMEINQPSDEAIFDQILSTFKLTN